MCLSNDWCGKVEGKVRHMRNSRAEKKKKVYNCVGSTIIESSVGVFLKLVLRTAHNGRNE